MIEINGFDELAQGLLEKKISKEQMLYTVKEDPDLIPLLLHGVDHKKAAVRYGCSKDMMDLSEDHPEQLYSEFDFFVKLLDSKYRILIWNAFVILANLTRVDVDKKFDAVFDKYYSFLDAEHMVTVANLVGNSGKIANAKPYLVPKITEELLKVQNLSTTPHLTEECKRVIAQQAIDSFDEFFDKIDKQQDQVLYFVKLCLNSSRKKLRSKAENFLKKWNEPN
ncbi:MAG: hypothetical protein P8X84_04090 [Candidatus Bathyarchaeota archaeon]